MIVPRTRLLLWIAAIVLPFSAIGATVPGTLGLSVGLIGGLLVLAAVDALLGRGRLAALRVELPELVRLQKDRPGALAVRLHHAAGPERTVRLGLAFPRTMEATDDRAVLLPAGAALSQIDWPLTPRERGPTVLDRVWLEAATPLGFWAVRASHPVRAELRVYPNLADERKNVAAVFLRRATAGARTQRRAGQGREFEKLREYFPGDSPADVHWKASAKRGHLVTKVHQIERSQEVYVIVDASRLSAREVRVESESGKWHGAATPGGEGAIPASPSTLHSTLERYVTASLILGLAAEQQGDQFGLVTFSDRVLSFVRAKAGTAHYDACRDRLYALQPQQVSPDFEELCSFLRLRLRRRALLIFLTALDDPMLAESFSRATELLSRQHLLIVNMLQPAGAGALFSEEAPAENLDALYQRLGGHLRWRDLRELGKTLERRGVRFSLLDPARLTAQLVAQHAEVKARQLL
jgi:uncharacterized protein (DUF58 family)